MGLGFRELEGFVGGGKCSTGIRQSFAIIKTLFKASTPTILAYFLL